MFVGDKIPDKSSIFFLSLSSMDCMRRNGVFTFYICRVFIELLPQSLCSTGLSRRRDGMSVMAHGLLAIPSSSIV